jgi:uncharacterized coiled-coil protein SlyX
LNDEANNLVLTQLRAIRDDLGDVKNRLANIEASQATTLQHLGHMAGTIAQVQVGVDRHAARLGRIEDRLGLVDA